jgi:LAGLIDADG endonuclease
MPGLVGGFGKYKNTYLLYFSISNNNKDKNPISNLNQKENFKETIQKESSKEIFSNSNLGSYLAGLIEGDGTFAIHNKKSTANKYKPKIIIVFKKADLPLALYLKNITNCGKVFIKSNRGYVLWQIQDIVGVFTIVNLINGYMRTPKIEALHRTIIWLNEYILNNQISKLHSTNLILSKIYPIEPKFLDNSSIDNNSWLSGFSDADSNFSINIHKRFNKNSTRVQLFFRLEIRQTYHRLDSDEKKISFYSIMSILGSFLGVNILSRSRIKEDKQYYSFIVMAHNKNSHFKIKEYFSKFPLLSSKYLDYKDWVYILELQKANSMTTSYLDKAINIRKDFNKTRTTYNWNHLNDCYLKKNQ